ncbi:hypothetical protein [Comamonas jiangduensis]|uniref:hypothetical protein n=1 Tax=Comamonas jiangduensis TaxID=1194168 RepID=UPI001582AFD7|nr:hypothetical protein [Comamonas jiangduensis]
MHEELITLTELNETLKDTCSVNAAQLQNHGFTAMTAADIDKDSCTDAQWRKYRNARLYKRTDVPAIRAAIAKSLAADSI